MNTVTNQEAQALASAFTAGNPFRPNVTRPSWKTMEETLRQWHEDTLDDPEFQWLDVSFEDMADKVSRAVFNAAPLEQLCTACDGSGEGQHDGTRCYKCKGSGEVSA